MPTREEKRPGLSKAGGHSATPGVVTAEGVRMCVCGATAPPCGKWLP